MYHDILGFSITPFMQRIMNINGFFASIMRAEKKSNDNGRLPPGIPIPVLPVDYLKSRPDNWVGGEGSYICPVDEGWSLWFNYSMNNPANTAVLTSVKGMNPLTGQRTNGYELEEYQDECPVHHKPFSKGRLCKECGFKWPAQNFIAQPTSLYLDGFVTPDGVRQFYFTEDMAKSVPELCIGREDTVPAFGFAFFKLKNYNPTWEGGNHIKNEFPKDSQSNIHFYGSSVGIGVLGSTGVLGITGYRGPTGIPGIPGTKGEGGSYTPGSFTTLSESRGYYASTHGRGCGMSLCNASASSETSINLIHSTGFESHIEDPKTYSSDLVASYKARSEVGIGAGARINQSISKSKRPLEDWEKKPAGVIRLYFVFQEEFEKYAADGFNNLEGNKLGYLEGVPVEGVSV